jgi:uncharacterized membrane protein
MTQHQGRWLAALVGLGVIVTGCGGWVDLDTPKATGGSVAGSTGAAGKPAAMGGAVGLAGSGSEINGRGGGAPTGSPVDNGAGGELLNAGGAAPEGARFQLLAPPPPTLLPDDAGAPGVTWIGTSSITSGSLEAGVLLGSSQYCFHLPGSGFNCDWATSEPFVWTEAAGMAVLDHLNDIPGVISYYPQFVSDDAATVVGMFGVAKGFGGYFRWTKTGGMTRLGEPAATDSGSPEHMSLDGRVVSGMAKVADGSGKGGVGHQPFLWTVAQGYRALAGFGTWPDDAELVGMSEDGSLLVGQTTDLPKRAFRWSPTTGVEQLGTLPDLPSCTVERISANAGTIFGSCQNYPDPGATFVWTESAGIAPVQQGTTACQMYPNALSQDGAIAFGTAVCGAAARAAVRWSAATGVVALPAPVSGHAEVSMNATNPPGSMTFGVLLPAGVDDFTEQGVNGAAPFRWSAEQGLVPLEHLPGHMFGYAFATDVAGEVLVGRSGNPGGQSEAVLWDSEGDIGIAAYLSSLGVNLNGAHLQRAERVATRGGFTIVQGIVDEQNRTGAWVAWLPQRQ